MTFAQLARWASATAVRDDHGNIQVVYHGTTKEVFTPCIRHGFGPHFSSSRQTAVERIVQAAEDYGRNDSGTIHAAVLNITNPVRMRDVHFDDDAYVFIDGLLDCGAVSRQEAVETFGPRVEWDGTRKQRAKLVSDVVAHLQDSGFDGIAYRNYIEGTGELTWIPFSTDQIAIIKVRPAA